jgi:hypothetical protein
MTSRASHHRSRKGRANARPLQDRETIARTDDDEILESLIDYLSSERPASLGCAGPCRHSQTKIDIAAGSKTTTSLIEPV